MSKEKNWGISNIPDLSNKTIIITGGNSGLGFEAAKAFTSKGAEVVISSRSLTKGEEAKKEILLNTTDAKITVMELDLCDFQSIRNFAAGIREKYKGIDVLLNNAGIMLAPYEITKDGFEIQMCTNHLGHFALTALLKDLIISNPGSRIVNVSSMAHKQGEMDFDDLFFQNKKGYSSMKAYCRSKLANLLFTYEIQRRFEAKDIKCIAVAAHPGVSQTNLSRFVEHKLIFKILEPLMRLIIQNSSMGALPLIRAAVDPGVKGGEYYGPGGFAEFSGHPVRVKSNKRSHNTEDAKKLWEMSEKACGINFEI